MRGQCSNKNGKQQMKTPPPRGDQQLIDAIQPYSPFWCFFEGRFSLQLVLSHSLSWKQGVMGLLHLKTFHYEAKFHRFLFCRNKLGFTSKSGSRICQTILDHPKVYGIHRGYDRVRVVLLSMFFSQHLFYEHQTHPVTGCDKRVVRWLPALKNNRFAFGCSAYHN